jgi:hypothetical protein
MTVITLSDEQSRLLDAAVSPILLVDLQGRERGKVSPTYSDIPGPHASEEEIIADIERRRATHDGTFRLYSDLIKELRDRFPE